MISLHQVRSPNEIHDAIMGQPKGTRISYYRGLLAEDAGAGPYHLRSEEQCLVADAKEKAWSLHEDGHAILTQRRHGVCDFEYIATATGKR